MTKAVDTALTAVIATYAFLVGFVLAVCVFMSNADTSPEVSLTLTHPLRSIALLALVAWPFVTMLAVGRNTLTGMALLVSLCLCVTGVGLVCATSDHGAFEAFSGAGALRRETGDVYVAVSLFILLLVIYRARDRRA